MISQSWTQVTHFFTQLVVLCMLVGTAGLVPAPDPQPLVSEAKPAELLQFTSGGHMLGFAPDKVYLAGLDHALTVTFLGGKSVQPQAITGMGSSKGKAPPLERVSYKDVWPEVDIVYTATNGGIAASTYLLAPKAKVESIRLKYNVPVKLANGELHFDFESGYMTESKPIAWQDINGKRVAVSVRFEQRGKEEVGFVLGEYDPSYSITIDPVYTWHTFFGSASADNGYGIAVDGNGNMYITGISDATWNGPGNRPPLNAYRGSSTQIFVLKLTGAGVYLWHTFYGSIATHWTVADFGLDIGVDQSGSIYVTGQSGTAWNGPGNRAPLNAHSGSHDIIVLKLNSAGAYLWHTFYGSPDFDYSYGIHVDSAGSIYLAATSLMSWNGPGNRVPLNAHSGGRADIVVLKLNSAGTYQWHTFYGSTDTDSANAIILDWSGNIYVIGESYVIWNGPGNQTPLNMFGTLFILKLNNVGSYQWHTFYGSSINDFSNSISVDGNGNTYVTGQSVNSWDGPGAVAPLNLFSGGPNEIFVLKLGSAGAYQWHTFYGSSNSDIGEGIALDSIGNVYVTGESSDSWTGPGGTSPLNAHRGNMDIVVLKLNSAGAYQWHAFYGSSNGDWGNDIAVDVSGNIGITGESRATWNGLSGVPPLNPFRGGNADIVTLKIGNQAPNNLALSSSSVPENQPAGTVVGDFNSTDPDVGDAFTYSLVSGAGSTDNAYFMINSNKLLTADRFSYMTKNRYTIRVRTTDSGRLAFEKSLTILVTNLPPIFADVPDGYWAIASIEHLYNSEITGGCLVSPLRYCPEGRVNRAQMAVFLERVMRGSSYSPPAPTGLAFIDVPASYWAAAWIEKLVTDRITAGCGPGLYCPEGFVTRAQMAVFLLKAEHGSSYSPPAATGLVFTDVPASYWATAWIEQLAREGITGGCAPGRYCPENPVTRAQMAVFLVRTFYPP